MSRQVGSKETLMFDVGDILEAQEKLLNLGNKANLILSRAVNRSLSNVSKNIRNQVSEEYLLKPSRVGKTIKTERKATVNDPTALIVSIDRHPTLSSFYFKSVRKGSKKMKSGKFRPSAYRAAVKHGDSHLLSGRPKPFMQRVNGNLISVRRISDNPGERKLEGVYGPAIPQMLKNREILDVITAESSEIFRNRVVHELDRTMKRG